LTIVALTLLVYSFVACIVFELTNEKEEIGVYFGIGVVGIIIIGIVKLHKNIKKRYKLITQRSIFKCPDGIERYCKFDKSEYLEFFKEYTIVERYANKDRWNAIEEISEEIIEQARTEYAKIEWD